MKFRVTYTNDYIPSPHWPENIDLINKFCKLAIKYGYKWSNNEVEFDKSPITQEQHVSSHIIFFSKKVTTDVYFFLEIVEDTVSKGNYLIWRFGSYKNKNKIKIFKHSKIRWMLLHRGMQFETLERELINWDKTIENRYENIRDEIDQMEYAD